MGIVTIPYKPRDIFIPYHNATQRFCLTVAHRRAGKTVARINKLVRKAIECNLKNPRFGYLAPYYVQAKDIAWLYLKHYSAKMLEIGGGSNESELSVTLPNGAIIRLYGAENADRMRGVYFDGIVIDEAQGIKESVLTQVILPALADRQGWLDVSGTPKGWENLLGKLYKMAIDDPEWFLQILKASETGVLLPEELARQRTLMSENEYEQEFECSFDAALTGSVYGEWISTAMREGRITDRVKYDPNFPVYTAWDLGYDDATAIWFYQVGPNELLFIDYYEFSGEGIGHYCDYLKGKEYRYAPFHYVPHDANNKVMAANGRSIVEQALKDHGVKMSVIPATSQQNGIEAGRKTLPRCWFNKTTCAKGIEALRNYHFPYDEELKILKSKPLHDWSSHASKAFEIAARLWANAVTNKELDRRALVSDFHNKRIEHNLERQDPYRMRSK